MQTSSVDDLDLSGSPSNLTDAVDDDGTMKIRVIDESRQQSSNLWGGGSTRRRQNIYILKVKLSIFHESPGNFAGYMNFKSQTFNYFNPFLNYL